MTKSDQSRRPRRRPASEGARAGAPARPYVVAAARIEQVRQVLGEVLQWAYPADAVLSRWFRAHPNAGGRDRGEIAEAVFDVLRHLRRYRQFAESGQGPATRRLAILGLASVWPRETLDTGLDEHERAWLDHVRAFETGALPGAVRLSLPDWLVERTAALEDAEALFEALNRPAPLDLRVNPLKIERAALLAAWSQGPEARWAPQPTPYSPWGIRIEGRPPINRWKAFERGEIEVQDEGSQLLAALVAPRRGEMVIDYCAGAGGKTLLLGALMRSTGRLYAFDVSAARLARAKPRFARSGLSNITPVVIAEHKDQRVRRLHGKAHRVLVDAPCSGLGTLRRNPDLKWRQHPEALEQLRQTQARILREAAACVMPGGRLVYASCSILPEENEEQVRAFLDEHPEFSLLAVDDILGERYAVPGMAGPFLRLRPDRHGTDGFFAAVMQRAKPDPAPAAETDAQSDPR
ncbi:RsmB/NOP family class I SAM-dependent RNA methyltransferase [Castellaniella sp. GW247-6E4]|uniref:RsmB/NOP family class I SAM-dependent RNA methyltransferase n=1 Tax=Castellaniella sp. GW247-6E4 TaxID=3140380 RepID=UPI003315C160